MKGRGQSILAHSAVLDHDFRFDNGKTIKTEPFTPEQLGPISMPDNGIWSHDMFRPYHPDDKEPITSVNGNHIFNR